MAPLSFLISVLLWSSSIAAYSIEVTHQLCQLPPKQLSIRHLFDVYPYISGHCGRKAVGLLVFQLHELINNHPFLNYQLSRPTCYLYTYTVYVYYLSYTLVFKQKSNVLIVKNVKSP